MGLRTKCILECLGFEDMGTLVPADESSEPLYGDRENIPCEDSGLPHHQAMPLEACCGGEVQSTGHFVSQPGLCGSDPMPSGRSPLYCLSKHLSSSSTETSRGDVPNHLLSGCTLPGFVSSSPFWNAAACMILPSRSRMALPPLSILRRPTVLAL